MKQIKSNDAMKKTPPTSTFRKRMSQSMAELRSIMASGASPTFNAKGSEIATGRSWQTDYTLDLA